MRISKYKNFFLLLPTLSVQYLTTIIQTVSVNWYILTKFGEVKSGLYLALYFSCCLIPQILLGPLLGVFVDKYDRKKIIFTVIYSRSISLLVLALFFFLNILPTVFLFTIVMINSAMNALNIAAINATIPNIVKDEHLLNANSIMSLNEYCCYIVGGVIAGFLYTIVGMAGIFLLNGILFALTGISLLFFRVLNYITTTSQFLRQKNIHESKINFKEIFLSLKEGVILIKKDKPIYYIILFGLIINFFLYPFDSILLPMVIKYTLQLGVQKYGLMQSITYFGAIFGLLVVTLIPKRNKLIYAIFLLATFALAINIIVIGILVSPISLAAIGNINVYFLLCVLSFIRYAFDSLLNIPIRTIYQKRIQDHLRGRFYGFMNTLWVGLQPLGSGIVGAITSLNYFSYVSIVVTIGLLLLIMAIMVFMSTEIKKLYTQVSFSHSVIK